MSRLIWICSVCPLVFDLFILKVFQNFADAILSSAFLALYELVESVARTNNITGMHFVLYCHLLLTKYLELLTLILYIIISSIMF